MIKRAYKDVPVGYYAVSFLDILNQKNLLAKIDKLPRDEQQAEAFSVKWNEILAPVLTYRAEFDDFFDSFLKRNQVRPRGFNREQRRLYERWTRCEIKKQVFSDSMIYFVSLIPQGDRLAITGVESLLAGCAAVFLSALSKGFVCRGGIEVGIAGEFFEGEVYGPALYQAYRLESDVARFPRIVLGTELLAYIAAKESEPVTTSDDDYRRSAAQRCRE